MPRPELSRVPEYFHKYINQVAEDELFDVLEKQASSFLKFLENISSDKIDYRYAEGKWSLKELLQHIIDTERIFAYRALCIARKDVTPLPGFDENSYASNSKADKRGWKELLEEFTLVRRSTQILFGSFDQEQSEASGIASGKPIYVLGIGFILAGHVNHHLAVIKEKYL